MNKLRLLALGIQSSIALLLSLVITLVNFGLAQGFFLNWAKGFVVAFLVIPLALRLIPRVLVVARKVLGDRSEFLVRFAVAVAVAVMMEGLISLAVTLVQTGIGAGLLGTWVMTFVKALPVGLLIGFTMTFVVQPRMQKLAASRQSRTAVSRA